MSSGKTLQERLKVQTVQEQVATLNEAAQEASELKNNKQSEKAMDLVYDEVERLQKQVKGTYDRDGPSEKEPLQLTLGIEIEFVLLRDTGVASKFDIPGTHRHHVKMAQRAVHNALSQPVHKQCELCGKAHSYSLPLNTLPGGCDQPRDQDAVYKNYEKWTVATDGSVGPGDLWKKFDERISANDKTPLNIHSHGIEVKSRVLSLTGNLEANTLGSCPHRPTVTFQDEITATYELLKKAFLDPATRIDNGAWCLLNTETCGLHVHIGNGLSSGERRFPLATVKNIVSMSTANERAIDNLHAKNRINGTTIMLDPTFEPADARERLLDRTVFNQPFSAQFGFMAYANRSDSREWVSATGKTSKKKCFPSALFKQLPGLKPDVQANDAMSWLRVVDQARKIEDLRDLQALKHHTSTVNLGNLKPDEIRLGVTAVTSISFTNTIEFRQAAGTVDPVAALAWVDVVVKLVEHCHNTSQAAMLADCLHICQENTHHTLDFLAMIGLGKKDATGIVQPGRAKSSTTKHYKAVMGLYRGKIDYAARLRNHELAIAASFAGQDDFHEIRVANAHLNYAVNNSKAANRRIEEKFLKLCFGQFSTQYLEDLAHPAHWPLGRDTLQPKLTIGWRPSTPVSSSGHAASDQESNPQDDGRYIKDSDPDDEADRVLGGIDSQNAARASISPGTDDSSDTDTSDDEDDRPADDPPSNDSRAEESPSSEASSAEGSFAEDPPADEDLGPEIVFGYD